MNELLLTAMRIELRDLTPREAARIHGGAAGRLGRKMLTEPNPIEVWENEGGSVQ